MPRSDSRRQNDRKQQGRSFRTILDTGVEPESWRKEVDYQYWMHMAHHDVPSHIAMRTKRFKLIQFYGTSGTKGFGSQRSKYDTPPAWELYDLEKDPYEMDNLYAEPAYADVVRDLKTRSLALRHRVRADDPGVGIDEVTRSTIAASNAVIDEFWDYSEEDRQKAVQISHDYFKRFGALDSAEKYIPPSQYPNSPKPSRTPTNSPRG